MAAGTPGSRLAARPAASAGSLQECKSASVQGSTLPSQVLAMAAAAMGFDYSRGRRPPSDPQHPRSRRLAESRAARRRSRCHRRHARSGTRVQAPQRHRSPPQRAPIGWRRRTSASIARHHRCRCRRPHLHTNAMPTAVLVCPPIRGTPGGAVVDHDAPGRNNSAGRLVKTLARLHASRPVPDAVVLWPWPWPWPVVLRSCGAMSFEDACSVLRSLTLASRPAAPAKAGSHEMMSTPPCPAQPRLLVH